MQQIGKKDKLSKLEIAAAVNYFNLGKITSFSLIKQGNINSNYVIQTANGKFILRAYKFKTKLEILSELELLKFLSSKQFPCPLPIGSLFATNQKHICCFKFIAGEALKTVSEKNLKSIARLTARLHTLTKSYQPKYKREGEGLSVIKKYLKSKKSEILNSKFKNSQEFISFLEAELKRFNFPESLPRGAVHVDIKKENIIRGADKKLHLIDFDNFYEDFLVIDIGSTIMWLCTDNEKLNWKKVKIFLQEYGSLRKLSSLEKKYLLDAIKFNCLKQAFKYAYICLPRLKFAEEWAYYFVRLYKNICEQKSNF